MIDKINITPVVWDHLKTLVASQGDQILKRDVLGFYILPLGISVFLEYKKFFIDKADISTAVICHSIFIPLILNAIFLIYSILEKLKSVTKDPSKKKKVLDHLYKNLAYTLLISSMSLIILALYHMNFHYTISLLIRILSSFFIFHIALTSFMIIKRCHLLLKDDI